MKLRLERNWLLGQKTLGTLYVNGKFFGYTVEDKVRPKGVKVYGETAIPFGTHNIDITMSSKFGRNMPEIKVDNFQGIRIHKGTDEKWSEGCLIVSKKVKDGKLVLDEQTPALLNTMILDAAKKGEKTTIEIVKADRFKVFALGVFGAVILGLGFYTIWYYNKQRLSKLNPIKLVK